MPRRRGLRVSVRSWEAWEDEYLRAAWPTRGLADVHAELNRQAQARGLTVRSLESVKRHASTLGIVKTPEYAQAQARRTGGRFLTLNCPLCGGKRNLPSVLQATPDPGRVLTLTAMGPRSSGPVPLHDEPLSQELARVLAARARAFLQRIGG